MLPFEDWNLFSDCSLLHFLWHQEFFLSAIDSHNFIGGRKPIKTPRSELKTTNYP